MRTSPTATIIKNIEVNFLGADVRFPSFPVDGEFSLMAENSSIFFPGRTFMPKVSVSSDLHETEQGGSRVSDASHPANV